MSTKKILVTLALLFMPLCLTSCSGTTYKKLDYAETMKMPGYGYITMDFRQSKDIPYGRGYVEGKADYTIMYVNHGKALFVDVKNVPFDDKIFDAYIPYYKGYAFRNISRMVYLPQSENDVNPPRSHFVSVYAVQTVGRVWCPETEYKNRQTFNYDDGCHDDWRDKHGAHGVKEKLGDVFITPHFSTDDPTTFTNRTPPERARVGA